MTRRGKILLVDDQPAIRRLFEAIFLVAGYELVYAENGLKGIAAALREPPDVILLDVMMPEMDGFAVCRHLKGESATAAIPVVFLTARGAESDQENARRAGARAFLTKPFRARDVLALLEEILGGQ